MNDHSDSSDKSVPAVRRAAAILRVLSEGDGPFNLSQISRETGVLPSTALHILRELAVARFVVIDASQKTYGLGPGLIELAQAASRLSNFADVVRPVLQKIAMRFSVTAMATVKLDAEHNACVASVSPDEAMSLNVVVGGRVPLLAGAAGRCVAAFATTPVSEVRKRFDKVRWQVPLDYQTWLAQVDHVREHGFAEDDGFFSKGIVTLAVPLFNQDGSVTNVIGVASIAAALEMEQRIAIVEALQAAAKALASRSAPHAF